MLPIRIKSVIIHSSLGEISRENTEYYNIIVDDCPKYIQNPRYKNSFIREKNIVRYKNDMVQWPDHPLNDLGENKGAIIIIKSIDNLILLVRNGKLWGFPKGARNYKGFAELKDKCISEYRETGCVPVFESIEFSEEESNLENVCRETLEETGIYINVMHLEQLDQSDHPASYTRYYYETTFTSDEYFSLLQRNGTDHENDELLWVTSDELDEMLKRHRKNKVFNHVTFNYIKSHMCRLFDRSTEST